MQVSKAAQLVLSIREGQILAGYTAAHDDKHTDGAIGELARRLVTCLLTKTVEGYPEWIDESEANLRQKYTPSQLYLHAAALCIAESERLGRLEASNAT